MNESNAGTIKAILGISESLGNAAKKVAMDYASQLAHEQVRNAKELLEIVSWYYENIYDGTETPMWVGYAKERIAEVLGDVKGYRESEEFVDALLRKGRNEKGGE